MSASQTRTLRDLLLIAGLFAAMLVGALMGLAHHAATHKLGMDHVVSGVALNMLAFSGSGYLLRRFFTRAQPPDFSLLAPFQLAHAAMPGRDDERLLARIALAHDHRAGRKHA